MTCTSTKTLRKVKKGIVGVKKMPEDSLANQQAELDDLDALFSLFQEVAKRMELATSMLERAPTSALFDKLQKFYKGDAAKLETLKCVSEDVTATSKQLQSGIAHLQSMQVQVTQFKAMRTDVKRRVVKRDEAWGMCVHYDEKASSLKEKVAKSQNSKSRLTKTHDLEDRLLRTEQKRRESQDNLKEATAAASTHFESTLATQRDGVGKLLSDLCLYYSDAFQDEARKRQRLNAVAAFDEHAQQR